MNNRLIRTSKIIQVVACVVCFLTNLSQMPYLVESSLTRYISIPVWILFAGICILVGHCLYIEKVKHILIVFFVFILYYIIALIFNSRFQDSALPYPICLSMFVLIVGILAGKFINEDSIKLISTYYVLSGMLVCVNVYFTYIYGHSLNSASYLYASKNSVSQILLTTWTIILINKLTSKGVWKKMFYVVCFGILTWTMIALKSRATLLGIPIAMLWIVSQGRINKKLKWIVMILLLMICILMTNDNISDFIINQILYGGRDANNLSALSSGRSDEWGSFLADWSSNWLFGQGRAKRESIILTALLEYGLIGGSLILVLAISPFIWGIITLKVTHPQFMLFTTLSLVYIVNGVFEQLAPFGPGVKCYFLWFLLGILASKKNNELKYVSTGELS